jgi:uncharacterized RDD family membrane protein YckC
MCALGRDRVPATASVPPERTPTEEEDVVIAPVNQPVPVRYMGVWKRLLVFLIDWAYLSVLSHYAFTVPMLAPLIFIWWLSGIYCFAWGSPGVLLMG